MKKRLISERENKKFPLKYNKTICQLVFKFTEALEICGYIVIIRTYKNTFRSLADSNTP